MRTKYPSQNPIISPRGREMTTENERQAGDLACLTHCSQKSPWHVRVAAREGASAITRE